MIAIVLAIKRRLRSKEHDRADWRITLRYAHTEDFATGWLDPRARG
jgi:hypothetical protein